MTDVRNAALGFGMGCLIGLALFYPDQAIWFFAAVAMAALAWALAGEVIGDAGPLWCRALAAVLILAILATAIGFVLEVADFLDAIKD